MPSKFALANKAGGSNPLSIIAAVGSVAAVVAAAVVAIVVINGGGGESNPATIEVATTIGAAPVNTSGPAGAAMPTTVPGNAGTQPAATTLGGIAAGASCGAPWVAGGPFFEVAAGGVYGPGDYVEIYGYTPGALVDVEVSSAPGGTVIGNGSGTVGSDGYANIPISSVLEVGHYVRVTDIGSGSSRDTTVALLDFSYIVQEGTAWATQPPTIQPNDEISGVAPAGSTVHVMFIDDPAATTIHGGVVLDEFDVVVDGAGVWVLDLSGSGYDLTDGTADPGSGFLTDMVGVRVRDCDGDATRMFCPGC